MIFYTGNFDGRIRIGARVGKEEFFWWLDEGPPIEYYYAEHPPGAVLKLSRVAMKILCTPLPLPGPIELPGPLDLPEPLDLLDPIKLLRGPRQYPLPGVKINPPQRSCLKLTGDVEDQTKIKEGYMPTIEGPNFFMTMTSSRGTEGGGYTTRFNAERAIRNFVARHMPHGSLKLHTTARSAREK